MRGEQLPAPVAGLTDIEREALHYAAGCVAIAVLAEGGTPGEASARVYSTLLRPAERIKADAYQQGRADLAAAWDEGHRLTAPHSDRCEPTCPNPYRAAAPTPTDHTHETGGAWHVTRWTVPGCPACAADSTPREGQP